MSQNRLSRDNEYVYFTLEYTTSNIYNNKVFFDIILFSTDHFIVKETKHTSWHVYIYLSL